MRILSSIFFLANAGFAAVAVPDFNRDIRPILSENCFRCHGPDAHERKGGQDGLRLDTLEGATTDLGGGGFAIVPGKPEKSELLARLISTDDEEIMPPRKTGKTLSPAEIDLLKRWIAAGANYAPHWSYAPPRRAPLPAVKFAAWPRGAIDRFIMARLEQAKLLPQPEADRATLARRVALDLTGLPPSLAEVEAFAADRGAEAYEKFVDRQLAKPAYGEHWARAWLDLARYADSKGYADDQARNIWRYRDTVIDAFNRNQPFDQFSVEQLAGDLLPNPTEDQLFATGFHRNTMNNTEGGTDDEEFRTVAVVDRVNTTMAVWMGTSLACAQCHTHKYDPLTQKEYFQLYAFFNQTEDADRNDEAPVQEFFTDAQKKQRSEWEGELVALNEKFAGARTTAGPAMEKWAQAFPRESRWSFPRPAVVKSVVGAVATVADDGKIFIAAGKRKDTATVELEPSEDAGLAALRIESLPHESLPGGGAGGAAGGNFVVSRVRVAVRPAEPMRSGRFVRVEMTGQNATLALAEVEIFSDGQNIAPRGVASQSSTAEGAPAARANDGVTAGDPARNSVSTTESGENPWWEIDLQGTQRLERVAVWGRTGLEPMPGGLRIVVLDAQRNPVWEQIAKDAPKPSRAFNLGEPQEVKLALVATDFAQADHDESWVISDVEPRPPAARRRGATKRGWGVSGAADRPHALTVALEKPLTLAPGERLVVTIEQQSEVAAATLNHFRVGTTADARATDRLRVPAAVLAAVERPAAERDSAQGALLVDHYVRQVAPELQNERQRVTTLRKAIDEQTKQSSPIMRELATDKRRVTHVQLRGNFQALGERVEAGVPAVFPPLPAGAPTDRLALARWLVSGENPLTARVVANRYWEAIFGIGLVRTAEEFGSQGEPPTHPELLDWLALELSGNGWDTKRFLKSLVMSAAYRQSSRVTPEALEADPENRLLSRGPRFRLGAELVRDQALAVSGLLSAKTHGPSVRPYQPAFGLKAAFGSALDWKMSAGEDRLRRGLYTEWRRSSPYPSMVTFDAPNREVCTLRRNRSNTPLQALVTLNDPVYVEAAQALARLIAAGEGAPERRVRDGFLRVLARPPTEAETKHLAALYRDALARFTSAPEQAAALIANVENPPPVASLPAELAAWTTVANVLLNLDEALMKR